MRPPKRTDTAIALELPGSHAAESARLLAQLQWVRVALLCVVAVAIGAALR